MKYDVQLADLKNHLAQTQNILITLPAALSVDKLAASLALMLGLKKGGKKVSIATEGTPLVAHSNLFGVGEVKDNISASGEDNYTIILEGVVEANGQIPTLEKLDWYPEGANLNLVFHPMPGQKFEPKNLTTKIQGGNGEGNFDLIFVIGASNLNELGSIHSQNQQVFNSYIVNIDNTANNGNFGKVNVVDTTAGSVSEMVIQIMQSLGLQLDEDIASNIVAGIYEATNNLTSARPDSFIAIGQAMQAGAKIPATAQPAPQPQQTVSPAPTPVFTQAPSQPQATFPQPQPQVSFPQFDQTAQNQGFDLSKVLGMPPQAQDQFVQPPVANTSPVGTTQVSAEERPQGEFATSASPESPSQPSPDWLTPKIFKGGSLG